MVGGSTHLGGGVGGNSHHGEGCVETYTLGEVGGNSHHEGGVGGYRHVGEGWMVTNTIGEVWVETDTLGRLHTHSREGWVETETLGSGGKSALRGYGGVIDT